MSTIVSDSTREKTLPLTAHLETEIERLILGGELEPGERLNELQLSSRFGTSRGPLREAMRSLQARGLVEIVPNQGMYVRSISLEEVNEIYDVRAAIFGLAGRILTDILTDSILEELNKKINTMDELISQHDSHGYYVANLDFHTSLITATRSQTLIKEYISLVNKLQICRARNLVQTGAVAVSNREHREMVDALASGDKYRAQESFFRHVERGKRRFLDASRTI